VKTYFREIRFSTKNRIEIHNITPRVEEIVRESRIRDGIVVIHAPHATAAIVLNEDEEGLKNDIISFIQKNIPYNYPWKHNLIDDNAGSHLASVMLGSTRVIPLSKGDMVRGTWQEILFIELDGPRTTRRVVVEVLGD
jgi:secondary thiamine-phosphate synthase enzyme